HRGRGRPTTKERFVLGWTRIVQRGATSFAVGMLVWRQAPARAAGLGSLVAILLADVLRLQLEEVGEAVFVVGIVGKYRGEPVVELHGFAEESSGAESVGGGMAPSSLNLAAAWYNFVWRNAMTITVDAKF